MRFTRFVFRACAAIGIAFGLCPPPTSQWQRDALAIGIWFALMLIEKDDSTRVDTTGNASSSRTASAVQCEACDAGYRLGRNGVHYDDAHGGSTWGVCQKIVAANRTASEN